MTPTRPSQFGSVFLLLLITLFTVFMYTFLHEAGHALVGLLFGGQINAFSVNFFDLSAHVGISGDFTRFQRTIMNLAGVSLPFLAWLVFILATPKKSNLAIEIFKVTSALFVLNVFLVWIVFPFLYMRGSAPSDDATHFLNNSGAPPLLVAGLFLLLSLGGWALFLSKIDGVRNEIALFRNPGEGWLTPGAQKTLGGMAGVFVLAALGAFAANGFRLTTPPLAKPGQPPPGYSLVETIRLNEREHTEESLLSFTLDRSETVGIFLLIQDIDTEYFDVKLAGPDQYSKLFIHGEGYATGFDSSLYEERLKPGEYHLILTSLKSPGVLAVYAKGLP
jgi:hypothetical protein